MLRFFRISEANSDEMGAWEAGNDGSREYFRRASEVPLSLEHERRCAEACLAELGRILASGFPTTLEEDEAALRTTPPPRNLTLLSALRYRLSRKRILEKARGFVAALVRRLEEMKRAFLPIQDVRARYPDIYLECAREVYPMRESSGHAPPRPPSL